MLVPQKLNPTVKTQESLFFWLSEDLVILVGAWPGTPVAECQEADQDQHGQGQQGESQFPDPDPGQGQGQGKPQDHTTDVKEDGRV